MKIDKVNKIKINNYLLNRINRKSLHKNYLWCIKFKIIFCFSLGIIFLGIYDGFILCKLQDFAIVSER